MEKWTPDEVILREKAPLFEALSSYVAEMHTSFHMPATRPGVPAFSLLDVTELPATDDLNEPRSSVLEAQAKAAAYFGAAETRFLTEGSSQGIFAALLALAGPEGSVLLPRPVHRAFMYAAQRFSLNVYFALPTAPQTAGAFTPLTYPSVEDYEQMLKKHPEIAVIVVTAPDYYGYMPDLAALEALSQTYEVKLLIDAAHGAHLQLIPTWRLYGDVVITSAHKTLPAVTPAAYLHVCEQDSAEQVADLAERLDFALKVLRTSSPPLFVAASADWARAYLEEKGCSALERQKKSLEWLRSELPEQVEMLAPVAQAALLSNTNEQSGRTPAAPLRPRVYQDPLRVVLDVSYYMSGTDFAAALAEMGVQCEFADLRRVILIPSLMSESTEYLHLVAALAAVAEGSVPLSPEQQEKLREEDRRFYLQLSGLSPDTDKRPTPATAGAFLSGADLNAALRRGLSGRAQAFDTAVIPYPPGIPLYWPTELR